VNFNLVNLNLAEVFRLAGPQFLYLWTGRM
jgi:hypothetical protein